MDFEFIPFAHDYYIITLPDASRVISEENRRALFDVLRYRDCRDYHGRPV
jgi:hypothetical protein